MRRLIDRDALMKQLGIAYDCDYCEYQDGEYCKRVNDFVSACEAISEAPLVTPQKFTWIPFDKQKPEKESWYLCTLDDNRVVSLYWYNKRGWVDNVRWHMFDLYDIRSRLTGESLTPAQESVYWNNIVAWCEMPEPYKEEV